MSKIRSIDYHRMPTHLLRIFVADFSFQERQKRFYPRRGHVINKTTTRRFWFVPALLSFFFYLRRNIFQRLEPVADTSNTKEEKSLAPTTRLRVGAFDSRPRGLEARVLFSVLSVSVSVVDGKLSTSVDIPLLASSKLSHPQVPWSSRNRICYELS